MFRCAISVFRNLRPLSSTYFNAARILNNNQREFSSISNKVFYNGLGQNSTNGLLVNNKDILNLSKNVTVVPFRTVTKFSLKKGKRKTSKTVVKRFFRLHWGAWIRPKVARKKRLWTKSAARKRRLRQHVFTNGTQTTLLDKMVTKFWKKPKYYVEDPYAPYHTREEFYTTRSKPIRR